LWDLGGTTCGEGRAVVTPVDYGRCPCGGAYERRAVEVRMTVDDQVVVLEDVPQGSCPECGSRVYKAATLVGIESAMRGVLPPSPRLTS